MSRRRGGNGSQGPIGLKLLNIARADLVAGVVSPSARVSAMLESVGLSPGDPWNAAALSLWVQEAAEQGGWSRPPVHGATAEEIVAQLQASGRWKGKADLALDDIKPGMIVAAYRNETLCVGVVDSIDEDTSVILTIEGMAGEGQTHVWTRTRVLSLPSFVGVGIV